MASTQFLEHPGRKAVGLWLFGLAALIVAMLAVGGLTRLTGSGLSITEWKPIMGAIPPLSHDAWMDAFHKYQQIPQYRLKNAGMTLEGFKAIFWWEWGHRFLGRAIGFVFLVPFAWFAVTGAIKKTDWPRMLTLFVLGGLQGFVGWWMVMSGLETRTSVSQYRLAIHLGMAVILLGAILWVALEYLRGRPQGKATKPAWLGMGFAALVFVQMLLGALVAGLHAGLEYNTWPSMNGNFLPEHPFTDGFLSIFENPGLAQFDHRMMAYGVAAAAWLFWSWLRTRSKAPLSLMARRASTAVLIVTALQILLGIETLLYQAPVGLAALHQVLAALLFSTAIWQAFELRKQGE
ncbi:cytochrome c oxidase assembly protein subunit 15 [Rhizomicrobium palustre]|uniref:Heme A synthase n=1 Tax=Rhizomicrobium palustre TaxID=189966 RepID=A0A846N3T2_9PROT|nr:COX15/CtaA family protein [Rhizomicrobium palustre]NIK89872.1 cytochrome c oxidase assembly protein subunit 15 [Rhizomicrobium palustre]